MLRVALPSHCWALGVDSQSCNDMCPASTRRDWPDGPLHARSSPHPPPGRPRAGIGAVSGLKCRPNAGLRSERRLAARVRSPDRSPGSDVRRWPAQPRTAGPGRSHRRSMNPVERLRLVSRPGRIPSGFPDHRSRSSEVNWQLSGRGSRLVCIEQGSQWAAQNSTQGTRVGLLRGY